MKDRSDSQRAKARAMMPGMATGVTNLAREMTNPKPSSPAMRLARGPADKYVRPGTGMKERPIAAYANGGKVSKEAKHEKAEARADMRQDKKMIAGAVHKHERGMHPGKPMTKLKHGGKAHMMDGGKAYAKGGAACAPRGKVARYAAGGAAKYRRGEAKPVPKMPKGGNPVY